MAFTDQHSFERIKEVTNRARKESELEKNIFAESSTHDELTGKASEFENFSKKWAQIVTGMIEKGNILDISNESEILDALEAMTQKILVVQKSLAGFLETKREAFPRFYFLSDDDLLFIIGQGSPKGILPHLKKCFGGLTNLEIVEKREEKMREVKITRHAKGMYSDFDEYVEFSNPILLEGPVEKWMTKVEEMMRFSLLSSLPKSLHACCHVLGKDLNLTEAKWLNNWPSQICILSVKIAWTAEVTHAINEVQEMAAIGPLKNLRKKWREILNQFTKRFQNEQQILLQMKAMAILLTLAHACDVIDSLIKYMCNDPSAFEWLVNLRYYYDETEKDCFIHQTNAKLKYQYEFLSCGERLVITPLTERCFLSLTMALHLHQSILLQGRDGVGKTETLKELGRCIGNYVMVVSCSETLTSSALIRNVSAISQIGVWCLLEHFDQLNLEKVTVISQQINAIFEAFRSNADSFSFEGANIPIKEGFSLFLSVSSACSVSKYELPSSLTNTFRPLSMSAPDMQMIVQVHLFAYGVKEFKTLALDLNQIFSLAQEQLPLHKHYDFSLRTVMSFLKLFKKKKDLLPDESDGELKEPVEVILKKNVLQPLTSLVQKVIQLHEMKKLFHALILVGDGGTGKTTTWKTLRDLYSHSESGAKFPSVEVPFFLSNEKWIVLDGPMHMDWLINLHSLIDNNKIFTVSNGETIFLPEEHLDEEAAYIDETKLCNVFWFSAIWSVGSSIDKKGREIFSNYIRTLDESLRLLDTVFDYFLDEDLQWTLVKSSTLHKLIEDELERTKGSMVRPRRNKLLCFLDDLNSASCDQYGFMSVLELIRMTIDHNIWYSDINRKFNAIEGVHFMASVTPPGRPGNQIPDRLLNRFCVIRHFPPEVFDRLLIAAPELISKSLLIRFWCHECSREFSDKLMNVAEKERFTEIMDEIVMSCFSDDVGDMSNIHNTWFVKFLKEDKSIVEVEDIMILENKFQESVDVLNKHGFQTPVQRNELPNLTEDHSLLNMVFFKNFVDHVHHIVRGLTEPFGHMCLIGSPGTGRRTLSRISAVLLKYYRFEITSGMNYGEDEFKRDLRMLLHETGVNQKKVVFLLSEEQIAENYFFEYLSLILSLENVTDFYRGDRDLRNDNYSSNEDFMQRSEMFVENVKQNFHLIISLNYSGVWYKKFFLKFPALFKNVTIDCFDEWPQEALETVAHYHLQKVLNEKRKKVEARLQRLSSGLMKINEAEDAVRKIAAETAEAREKLIVAERECDEALEDLQRKRSVAALKKEFIQEKKVEIERKERACQKIAVAAQEDLNAALPALEEARKALEALNKKDIGEIKSYSKPPVLVEIVLEAVMILRQSEPSWTEAKRQLGNPSFLKELLEYDSDNIPESALKKVFKYIQRPEFQPHIVGKVSIAAKSLCMWVRAMHMYGMIYKKVKPKKERLRIAMEELEMLQRTQAELLRELKKLEDEILQLEKEHELLLLKKEEYAKNARLLALKLERAQKIMSSLKSEQLKWQEKISVLEAKHQFIFGDSFLAAGFLTYLGPLGPVLRQSTFHAWKRSVMDYKFSYNPDFDPVNFFLEEETSDAWNMHELPLDQYSYENATIFGQSYYCPFIIDPQEQAFKWLKNVGSNQNLRLIDSQDPNWTSLLEAAVLDGCPAFLYNVKPDLFPALLPFLELRHRPLFIRFNGKRLQVKPTFWFYMSTKLEKPTLSTSIINKVNIVNFTIKEKGLEDQLLSLIVHNERSDLEVTKRKLVKSIADCKKQLYDIEDKVLGLLSKAHGSLLDDEKLVEMLNKSKSSSIQIEELLASNEKTQAVIDKAREKYRICAKDAAILYFVLIDLKHIDSMYVFSLDAYFELFMDSIKKSPRDQDLEQRIQKLKDFHSYAVFKFACRTVREKHVLILAFYMSVKILQGKGKLSKEEFELFINVGHERHTSLEIPNPCSQWLPAVCWQNIVQLEQMPKFLGITGSFEDMGKAWHEWYTTIEPEKSFLPGNWQSICTEFRKLIIIRCLRMDRITSCIHTFIKNIMGERFLAYPHSSFSDIVKDSVAQRPLVVIAVSGDIDPAVVISELAKEFQMQNKYQSMALSRGDEYKAAQLIIDSAKMGHWLFIHNCEVLPAFMLALEKTINKLNVIKVHPDFRLWLGTHPNSPFPSSILQNSVVITLESPQGIRDNMLNVYNYVQNTESYRNCENQSTYKSLLFSLSFFHSLVLERKKFHSLGWNAEYNFSFADFKMSENILRFYADKYKEIPWEALKGLIADVIYGGHMTNILDKRLLMTYFDQFFCDEACANIKLPLSDLEEYYIPEEGPLESHVNFIENLPSIDSPEVFGQHSNAEISHRMNRTEQLLNNLLKMHGVVSTLLEDDFSDQVLSTVQDLQQQIPSYIDEKINFGDNRELYNCILIQEVKKYNVLIKLVEDTLNNLYDMLTGKLIITEANEQIYQEVKKLKVPQDWHFAYPSMKPLGSWIKDLKARIQQLATWVKREAPPVKFWLPGFISPTSILTAAMQSYAKANDVAYKDLVWEYHVSTLDETHIRSPPSEGFYAQGLFLEGGGWDKRNSLLVEPEPLQLFTAMPVIHFKPVLESSMRGLYSCPCYYMPKRMDESGNSTFLFNVELKTKKSKEHWIKRGTALIMSTRN
ncbi:dynein axonemal heavy chain 2-like [Uloborus diversus]|uniref:dynein axonemal heavy chain 2-like n=1 Tax=Uloborus diversus TaxID=327109 RepID=UPI00240A2D46|nr:dynein axonemal heavy chain 2-like [Uloborus diversus]